jgi:wyosine [tRNA(Phe)-imidazoG37] synthetase (radical SAM superfamily)
MGMMRVKRIAADEENRKVVEINLLPSKHCTFRCVFCPLGQEGTQAEEVLDFEETAAFLSVLEEALDRERPEVLYINSMGESFSNARLGEVIDRARARGLRVRLCSNGTSLGDPRCAALASRCDEVSGELQASDEETYRRLHRPLPGQTLEGHLEGMARFREGYGGTFTLTVILVRGLNDDPRSLEGFRRIVARLRPDRLILETVAEAFAERYRVPEERLEEVRRFLTAP